MTRARPGLTGFLTAKAVSDVGYALDFVCMSVFVWERTSSSLATGCVSVVLYAGAILGGQVGGRYGRTWDRRRAMIGADLVRASALVVLAVLPGPAQTAWLYPVVFLVGCGRSIFESTLSAATPVLAVDRVQAVNSVLAGLKGVAYVVGMGAATVVVPVLGFRGVFGLDAGSYALSALVLVLLRLPMRDPAPAAGDALGVREPGTAGTAARAAIGPVLVAAGLVPLLALRGFDAFGSASQQVGLPIYGGRLRPDEPALFAGSVWGAWAVGLFLAGFVLRPLATKAVARAPGRVFCAATVVMSAGFIGVFWLPGWWPRLAAALVAGLGDAFSEITFKQAIQQLPDAERGSVFGFSHVVVNAGFMAGLAATSVIMAPSMVPRWVLLLHGVPVVLAGVLVAAPGGARRLRESAA